MVRGRRHRPVAGLGGGGRNHPQSVVRCRSGLRRGHPFRTAVDLDQTGRPRRRNHRRTIVDPLARLSGSEAEQDPDAGRRALRGIVEQAAADRVLQSGEAEMLSELMSMPARRVRDAMTPAFGCPCCPRRHPGRSRPTLIPAANTFGHRDW